MTEEFGSGCLYAAAMLALRLPSRNTDRIWTDRYRGTVISKPCLIESASVEYYADGIDDGHRVYIDRNVHPGDRYAPIDAALEAAGKSPCNLYAHYGEDAATGFTGWFKDAALRDPVDSLEIPRKGALKLYGRNRCTLRIEYAEGSVEPDAGTSTAESRAIPRMRLTGRSGCPISPGLPRGIGSIRSTCRRSAMAAWGIPPFTAASP